MTQNLITDNDPQTFPKLTVADLGRGLMAIRADAVIRRAAGAAEGAAPLTVANLEVVLTGLATEAEARRARSLYPS